MIMNGNAARDMRETGAVKKRAWFPFSEMGESYDKLF